MYYIYGLSGSSLLIESTDSMIMRECDSALVCECLCTCSLIFRSSYVFLWVQASIRACMHVCVRVCVPMNGERKL